MMTKTNLDLQIDLLATELAKAPHRIDLKLKLAMLVAMKKKHIR